jgi:dihydroxyacetone kinase-like predicted kinase
VPRNLEGIFLNGKDSYSIQLATTEAQYLESLKDVKPYKGKWIAILDNKIIASDEDIEKVYEEALKKSKTRTPLFTRIPSEGEVDTFIL